MCKLNILITHLEEQKVKKTVNKFVNGPICNYTEYVNDFEDLLSKTYREHSGINVHNQTINLYIQVIYLFV
jgi:hypothetical protein